VKKKIPLIIISITFSIIIWGTISLSEEYYANVNVPLRVVGFPNGYTIGNEIPENITIKLRGVGWKLFSVNIGKDVTYNISVNGDSGFKQIKLMDHLTDNRWMLSELDIIDIVPNSLSFSIERRVKKKLPIVADLSLDFKAGYGLAKQVVLEPDSVVIDGPQSVVNSLTEIKTKAIRLSSLDKLTIKNIDFVYLPGTSYGTKFVSVNLDIQRIVDKQFDDIDVEVLDVPPDRDVILLPNKISCNVRGGIDILGKLEKDQFRAFVFYRDVVLDTLGNVIPNIEHPENTTLKYIKPERLRYIIKKFR
jgi:YbbR domain-containing protein